MYNKAEISKVYDGSTLVYQNVVYLQPGTTLYSAGEGTAPPTDLTLYGVENNFRNIKNGISIQFAEKSTSASVLFGTRYLKITDLKFPNAYTNPLEIDKNTLKEFKQTNIVLSNVSNNSVNVYGGLITSTGELSDGHIRITPQSSGHLSMDTTLVVGGTTYNFVISKITAL